MKSARFFICNSCTRDQTLCHEAFRNIQKTNTFITQTQDNYLRPTKNCGENFSGLKQMPASKRSIPHTHKRQMWRSIRFSAAQYNAFGCRSHWFIDINSIVNCRMATLQATRLSIEAIAKMRCGIDKISKTHYLMLIESRVAKTRRSIDAAVKLLACYKYHMCFSSKAAKLPS